MRLNVLVERGLKEGVKKQEELLKNQSLSSSNKRKLRKERKELRKEKATGNTNKTKEERLEH